MLKYRRNNLGRYNLVEHLTAVLHQPSIRIGLVLVLIGLLFGATHLQNQVIPVVPDKRSSLSDVLYSPIPTIGQTTMTSSEEVPGIKVPILTYHYIEVNPDPVGDPGRDKLLVTPTNFEAQLKYLHDNGWTTVTLDDLVSYISSPKLMPAKPIILTFDDGYQDFYDNAWPLLRKYGDKATIYVLSRGGHPGACGNNFYQPNFYMTNTELRELAGTDLIMVEAHSQDHCSLKRKPEAIQWQEIFGSKEELETITGRPVRHFAYPYGAFDDVSIRIAKESGYVTASTTIPGTVNSELTIYTLRRIRIGNLSPQLFAAQLAK